MGIMGKPIIDFSIVKYGVDKAKCKSMGGKPLGNDACEISGLDLDELHDAGFDEEKDELWVRVDSEIDIDTAGKLSPNKVKELLKKV